MLEIWTGSPAEKKALVETKKIKNQGWLTLKEIIALEECRPLTQGLLLRRTVLLAAVALASVVVAKLAIQY